MLFQIQRVCLYWRCHYFISNENCAFKSQKSPWIQWKVCKMMCMKAHLISFRKFLKGFLSHNNGGRNDQTSCNEISAIVLLLVYDPMRSVLWESKGIPLHRSWYLHCSGRGIWFTSVFPSMRDETKTKLSLMKVTQCALRNLRLGSRETIKCSAFFDSDKVLEEFSSDRVHSRGGLLGCGHI